MAPLTTAARSLRPRAVVPAPVVDITPAPLPSPAPAPLPAPAPPQTPRAPSSRSGSSAASTASSGSVASSRSAASSGAGEPGAGPGLGRRVTFQDVPAGYEDRAALLTTPQSTAAMEPSPSPAPLDGLMSFLIPAAVATAVYTAGPLLFPALFPSQTVGRDGQPAARSDTVMWGLSAVALAALSYALVTLYRTWM